MTIIFETTDGRLWSNLARAVENQSKLLYPLALMDAGNQHLRTLMTTNSACAVRERLLDVDVITPQPAEVTPTPDNEPKS